MADLGTGVGVGMGIGLSGQPERYAGIYQAREAAEARKEAAKKAAKDKAVSDIDKYGKSINVKGVHSTDVAEATGLYAKAISESNQAIKDDPNNGVNTAQQILGKYQSDLLRLQSREKRLTSFEEGLIAKSKSGMNLLPEEQLTLEVLQGKRKRDELVGVKTNPFSSIDYDPETQNISWNGGPPKVNIEDSFRGILKEDVASNETGYSVRATLPDGKTVWRSEKTIPQNIIRKAADQLATDPAIARATEREMWDNGKMPENYLLPTTTPEQKHAIISNYILQKAPKQKFTGSTVTSTPKDDKKGFSISGGIGESDKFRYVYGETDNRKAKELWTEAIKSIGGGNLGDKLEGDINKPDFNKFISIARTDAQENTIQPFFDSEGKPIQARPMGVERIKGEWRIKVLKTDKRGSGREVFTVEDIPFEGENKGRIVAEYDNVEQFIDYVDEQKGHAKNADPITKGTESGQGYFFNKNTGKNEKVKKENTGKKSVTWAK